MKQLPSNVAAGGFFDLLLRGRIKRLNPDTTFEDSPNAIKPFKEHYRTFVFPHVTEFEAKRFNALETFRNRCITALPFAAVTVMLSILIFNLYHLNFDQTKILLIALAMLATVAFAWIYYPIKQYEASVKQIIFPQIFSFFGSDFKYEPICPITISSLQSSSIIPSHNRTRTEDYVRGRFKDVSIELFEALLQEESGSGKSRKIITKFKGIFIMLSMNKNFSGKTIVRQDRGTITNFFSNESSGLKKVKLEDPVFEKDFDVFGNDQVQARYLLTTTFMERLLKLKKYTGGSAIECSFYDNKLLLKISSNMNRFEPSSIYEPATFIEDIKTILGEMEAIFEIVDILKLDQKTGL